MPQPTDVVVAGTKAFALALFAPVTERAGARPRIAVDPVQALALCGNAPGVLVLEYDARWLATLQQLQQQAPGRRVVAALPRGQEAAALALAPLAVDAVPWDGQAGPVIAGLERALGSAPSAAPVAPPVAPPRPAPAIPRPPPAAVPVAPRAAPTRPAAVAPASPTSISASTSVPAPAPIPASVPAPIADPIPAPTSAVAGLFDDLEEVPAQAPAPAAAPAAAPRAAVTAPAVAPPPAPAASGASGAWPSALPNEDEAESVLVRKLRGQLPADAPLAAAAEQAVAAMTELERAAVSGADLPYDPRPVLRAAVMRFRVAVAIASVPAAPAAVDAEAVAALVAELDGVLAEVNGLAATVPAEQQPAFGFIRNALVKEAVDFSEVAHQAGNAPAPAEAAPRAARAPVTRVLSVQAGQVAEQDVREVRRGRTVAVLLVAAILAGGGFHAWRWYQRQQAIAALPTLRGAPEGMRLLPGSPGAGKVLVPGKAPPDRAQVERFKADQAALGFTVTEEKGGVLVVTPQQPPARPAGEGRTP